MSVVHTDLPLFRPDHNVWRIARADRAAVLIDAGRYFGAVREALLNAQESIFIIGWDIDSRTRLVGENCAADDGWPEDLIGLLSALVHQRPRLRVNVLVWDYSLLYAHERELFPTASLQWSTPAQIRFCLDDYLPIGASQHQKIVVIDDAVAFSGGLDLTTRRWDTRAHRPDDPRRVDLAGAPYRPFHDVQALVDGEAAAALGALARTRWRLAAGERVPPLRPRGDPWPRSITPDLAQVAVGIARTCPALDDAEAIHEVEALFFDMIDRAEHCVYIENQYLTSLRFASRLAERLQARPTLEAVLVTPKQAHSWLEEQTMQAGLGRFMQAFAAHHVEDRARLVYPQVICNGRDVDTMVHSKVMIVDDRVLRIGSANLNNRSFGVDTECDLAFAAETASQRHAVTSIRNRLVGHFCGVDERAVAQAMAREGSLIAAIDQLAQDGHRLAPMPIDGTASGQAGLLEGIGDPERPIAAPDFARSFVGERPPARRVQRFARVFAVGLALMAMMLAWRFTPLADLTSPDTIQRWFATVAAMPAAPLVVLAVFVVGGLLVFPVTLLIVATAAAFGPWLGFLYAATGAIASAIVGYGAGMLIGGQTLETVVGPRINRIRRHFAHHGITAVALLRMVPVAPFTVINVAAGASRVRFSDYLIGTVIGMLPGLALMSALGHQIFAMLTAPTPRNISLFVLAVMAWIGLSLGIQAIVNRSRKR